MLFNIPQFIDKEDKIVGPLTAKQLGWLAGGGILVGILWGIFRGSVVLYLTAVPAIGMAIAFAFYRPFNQSLVSFIISIISFFFHEKIYIWRRLPEEKVPIKKIRPENRPAPEKKFDFKKTEEISKLLDLQK